MLSGFLAILGAIPGLGSIIESVVSAITQSKIAIVSAKLGADTTVAEKIIQDAEQEAIERRASLSVVAGSRVLSWLVFLFAMPVAAYEWKVIIWDSMLGWGSTPAIHGDVAQWMGLQISFLFGAPTALTLGAMWFNRKS